MSNSRPIASFFKLLGAKKTKHKIGILRKLWYIYLLFIFSLLFWPGLHGPFFLDDLAHLKTAFHFSWPRLLENMFSHQSGPLGRPVSIAVLTLIQSVADQNPFFFKLANLLLHGFNACLILKLSQTLLKLAGRPHCGMSVLVALIWFAHPVMLPTVLYPIQFMVILSTFFSLLAIHTYLLKQPLLTVIFLLLAIFSKEIGLLSIGYIWLIEYSFLGSVDNHAQKRKALQKIFIGMLVVAGLGLFLIKDRLMQDYEMQAFDLITRLQSEPVVLLEYLKSLIAPNLRDIHLYQDDVLTHITPYQTALSLGLLLALLGTAFFFKKRQPLWFCLILCFFISQSLESSFFALELKFMHRIYFASFFIIFFWVDFLACAWHRASALFKKIILPFACFYLIFLGFITYSSSVIYGNEPLFNTMGEILHPHSLRAKSHVLLQVEMESHFISAEHIIDEMALLTQNQPAILLERMILSCWRAEPVSEKMIQAFITAVPSSKLSAYLINNLSHLISRNEAHRCMTESALQTLLDVVYAHPALKHHPLYQASLLKLKGRAAMQLPSHRIAEALFQAAYYANPKDHDALLATLILDPNAFSDTELSQHAFWLPALVQHEVRKPSS